MCEVKGKIFLITGAAGGIGAGVTQALVAREAKHVAILDINVNDGKILEAELNEKYGADKAKFHKCDVTTSELDTAFQETINQFGYIDVVINNAGIMNDHPDFYLKALDVNITALVRGSLKAYHLMRKDNGGKGGTIVNISSIVGLMQPFILPIYSATKSAVLQFSNCLGAENTYKRTGVRVVTVCYGSTDTDLVNGYVGTLDDVLQTMVEPAIAKLPKQGIDDAVRGFLVAFEKSCSGGTWLVTSGRPAEDITQRIQEGYAIMSKGIAE